MKSLIYIFIFSFVWISIQAQSIQITEVQKTANNSPNEFAIAEETMTFSNGLPSFAPVSAVSFDLNPLTAMATVVGGQDGLEVFDVTGKQLKDHEYDFEQGDSSIRIYAGPGGDFILRENIANFLFFDSYGNVITSRSNSSQSKEGESVSELAADPAYKTVVLYNPIIVRNGQEGSRARVLDSGGKTTNIFYSEDRAIRFVEVSADGKFIGVVSYKSGTDEELVVLDRFGNELNRFTLNQTISNFQISDDGRYLTLRSNSRVAAFSVLSGERLGSTSFRSAPVHFAKYIPEDHTIFAITGNEAGGSLSDIELHAINVEARKIQRTEYSGVVGISDLIRLKLERNARYNYTLSGLSKALDISVQF